MDLALILSIIRPGASWSLPTNDYTDLVWLDEAQTKPTLQEVEDSWTGIAYNIAHEAVRSTRQAAYIAQTDGLGWQAQRGEIEVQDWIEAVEAIRTANPYQPLEDFLVSHPDPEA